MSEPERHESMPAEFVPSPQPDPSDSGSDEDAERVVVDGKPEATWEPGWTDDPESEDLADEEPEQPDVLAQISGLGVNTGDIQVTGQNAIGHGATAIGAVIGMAWEGARTRAWVQTLSPAVLDEMAAGYAEAPSDGRLDRALGERRLVFLDGPPGSGRYTTACLASSRRHGTDRVKVLSGERLDDLIRFPDLLEKGWGYLLRHDGGELDAGNMTVVGLAARVGELGSTIIVIGTGDKRKQRLDDYLVEHRPASPVSIFRARLQHLLRRRCLANCQPCFGECRDSYVVDECEAQPALADFLAAQPQPLDVVRIAEAIAMAAPRGGELAALLDRILPVRVRRRAEEILEPVVDEGELGGPGGDYLRAFRLSCAVLPGQPVSEIRRAAQKLLYPGVEQRPTRLSLRELNIDSLLGASLRQAVVVGSSAGLRAGASRTIEFSKPNRELAAMMRTVAWSDWDIPEQLLEWLETLVRTGSTPVRQLAAGVIGWSARQDVEAALNVTQRLAQERRAGLRQAASIALVAMATQPQFRNRIRGKTNEWIAGSAYLRDLVARAYALGLSRFWPDVALDQLRRVAQVRMQRWNHLVARAVVQVYQDGQANVVVPALVDWACSTDAEVRLHAARSLRLLAERRTAPPRDHWPELLDLVRLRVLRLEHVATLWKVALELPETAYRSWQTLGSWLDRADGSAELAESCIDLLGLVAIDRPMRHRLAHQVRHAWEPNMPHNELLSRVFRLTLEV